MADETIILDDGTEITIHARMGCTFGEQSTHLPFVKYDPAQPRDAWGRWTATGSGKSVNQDIGIRTRTEGGSTTDVSGKAGSGAVTTGKALSVHPERSRVYKNGARMNEHAIAAAVDRYRRDHHDLLSRPGYSLGTWLDSETGALWLDVITVVETSAQADSLARKHNQIAYYDIDAGKEVRTGGTGLAKRHDRGLLARLRGWLNAGGSGRAPAEDDALGRERDLGRDRSSPPRPARPVVHKYVLSPRKAAIYDIVMKFNSNQSRHDPPEEQE